jgi:hypothetical protein
MILSKGIFSPKCYLDLNLAEKSQTFHQSLCSLIGLTLTFLQMKELMFKDLITNLQDYPLS